MGGEMPTSGTTVRPSSSCPSSASLSRLALDLVARWREADRALMMLSSLLMLLLWLVARWEQNDDTDADDDDDAEGGSVGI